MALAYGDKLQIEHARTRYINKCQDATQQDQKAENTHDTDTLNYPESV